MDTRDRLTGNGTATQKTLCTKPAFEPLEARVLLSADLIGDEPVAPLEVFPNQQAIEVDPAANPAGESDRVAPPPADNLHVVPDTGISAADGITNRLSLVFAGHLPGPAASVTLWDLTTNTDLGSAVIAGSDFTAGLTFTAAGLHQIRVRSFDAGGLYSDSFFDLVIDQTRPTVLGVSPIVSGSLGADGFSVRSSEDISVADMITDDSILSAVSLVRIGPAGNEAVDLSAGEFTYDPASRVLEWRGGAGTLLAAGRYRLSLRPGRFMDLAGNTMAGGDEPVPLGPELHMQAGGADIDVDTYSVPVQIDWNADGRPDLVVGEKVGASSGKVRVYLNSGTPGAPVYGSFFYVQAAGSDLTVPSSGCLGVYPRVFDWNQDGKNDLLVGLYNGTIRSYLNTGTAANPLFGSSSTIQAGESGAKVDIDVGDRATFDIVDWNDDGTVDLVAGGLDGLVRVYLNRQATGEPDLASSVIVQEGNAALVVPSGRASVAVYDFNGDGRKDLLLGNTNAQLVFYPNAGTDAAPIFDGHEVLLAIAGGSRSRPSVADLNADGIPDVLLGNVDGLLRYYLGTSLGSDFQTEFLVSGAVGYATVFPNISTVVQRRAMPFVMSEGGFLTSISLYHQGGTGHAIMAVYGDTGGRPGTRLGVTDSTLINSTEGWQTIALQSPAAVSSGQTIWLAWVFENDPGMRWIEGSPGRAISTAAWSGGMPDSFGVSTVYNGIYSIYATYSPEIDVTPPGEVGGLTATAGDGQIGLSWTNPGDADFAGVKIVRKQGGYPENPGDGTVIYDGMAASTVDTGLTNGTTYSYAAFTYDEVPNYSSGAAVSGTPVAGSAEGTVGYTTVFPHISGAVQRRAMPFVMSEGGAIESICIYHQGGTGHAILAVYDDAGGLPGARLGMTDSTLINGVEGWQTIALQDPAPVSAGQTIWLAWVFENDPGMRWIEGSPGRAISTTTWSGGMPAGFGTSTVYNGIYSIYATYTPEADLIAPANVTGLSSTAGDGRISLSWTNPGDEDFAGVKVLRKEGGYPGHPADGTVVYDGPGASHVDTGLTNGTTYYYTLFSYDEAPNYSSGATVNSTPVTTASVDETVGYTTVFPNVSTVAHRRAMPFVMSKTGFLTSISIYHQGGTGHAILAVYADAAGRPGNRLGVTDLTLINGAEGWQTFALQNPVAVSPGQTIWLAWVFENDPGMRWIAGSPGRAISTTTWSAGMPASFGASAVYNGIYSIYATYSAEVDVTPPGSVGGLTATAGDGRIGLSWTNPGDADFAGVRVLRKTGGLPAGPADGTVVYDGTGASIVDRGLANGTTYYYAAFSYDEVPNYSSPVFVTGRPVQGAVPVQVTVDNLDAGASFTGAWQDSGSPGPWAGNSVVSWTPGSTFTFTADLVPGNEYYVYAWWAESFCRNPAVPYEIRNGGTLLDTVHVNQITNGSRWNLLGVYMFTDTALVTILSSPTPDFSTNADAVRFVPVP